MKVYVYYLNNELYAWTFDKEIGENFESQRCMKVFKKVILKMDDNKSSVFSYNFRVNQITYDNLFDGTNDIKIWCTIEESNQLSESVEYVYNTVSSIYMRADLYPLKEKYCNFIMSVTEIINDGPDHYVIDTYKLFYDLFRYSLTGLEIKERGIKP